MLTPRIMIVDDDHSIRVLLYRYLTQHGFQVDSYPDAQTALAAFDAATPHHDIVVADLTLGGLPGDQLLAHALEASPATRGLLCSGYPFPLSKLPAAAEGRTRFLQKPFLPKALLSAIEELLAI